jgi:hypothetical protein
VQSAVLPGREEGGSSESEKEKERERMKCPQIKQVKRIITYPNYTTVK